jgi:hypothetical protein
MKTEVAKVTYASGWKLTFPCSGQSSRLFLEWYGNFQHRTKSSKYMLTFTIRRDVPDSSEIDSDIFVIRFDAIHRDDARSCADYINSNQ